MCMYIYRCSPRPEPARVNPTGRCQRLKRVVYIYIYIKYMLTARHSFPLKQTSGQTSRKVSGGIESQPDRPLPTPQTRGGCARHRRRRKGTGPSLYLCARPGPLWYLCARPPPLWYLCARLGPL